MSNRLMNLVWPLDLPQTEKSVLIALADRADDVSGQTWIAIRSLAVPRKLDLLTMTGLSERTIQNAIKSLNGKHLTRHDVPGRGVIYTIHPRSTCTPASPAPPQEMHPAGDAHTPAGDAPKPSVTLNSPSKASPSTEREHVPAAARILIASIMVDIVMAGCRAPLRKPVAAKRRWPRDMPPPPQVSDDQWAGLVEHRLARRKPLTPRAYELLCGRLAKVALAEWPPGRIVDTIVERGWTNFEEPWLIRISEQINGTGHQNDRSGRRAGLRDPLLRHYAGGGDPGLG